MTAACTALHHCSSAEVKGLLDVVRITSALLFLVSVTAEARVTLKLTIIDQSSHTWSI